MEVSGLILLSDFIVIIFQTFPSLSRSRGVGSRGTEFLQESYQPPVPAYREEGNCECVHSYEHGTGEVYHASHSGEYQHDVFNIL